MVAWYWILIAVIVGIGLGYGFRGKVNKGLHAAEEGAEKIAGEVKKKF